MKRLLRRTLVRSVILFNKASPSCPSPSRGKRLTNLAIQVSSFLLTSCIRKGCAVGGLPLLEEGREGGLTLTKSMDVLPEDFESLLLLLDYDPAVSMC
jgi:hypothetical protein